MQQSILTVSELNQLVRDKLDRDSALQNICIRGEISNYKLYPSGHHYFSLKDSEASIRCVLFKGNAASLRFRPENGMSILAVGKVSLYPRDGTYQFYCSRLLADGIGDLSAAFEQLKQKLYSEGLFNQDHKKELPLYPHRIGIVTSPAGAAVHDMLRILGKRYPLSKVILLPVRVQGIEAPGEISRAIEYANRMVLCDVLIVGRGGGSIEDLWAFNDETVCRSIYQSQIPVVSAVGHEPDVTISDFTADARAATPSNAAELVAPDQYKLRNILNSIQKSLNSAIEKRISESKRELSLLAADPMLKHPLNYLQEQKVRLDFAGNALLTAEKNVLQEKRSILLRYDVSLHAMSPLNVLSRGYSMTASQDGTLIRSVKQACAGTKITVQLQDGKLHAVVRSVEGGSHEQSINEF